MLFSSPFGLFFFVLGSPPRRFDSGNQGARVFSNPVFPAPASFFPFRLPFPHDDNSSESFFGHPLERAWFVLLPEFFSSNQPHVLASSGLFLIGVAAARIPRFVITEALSASGSVRAPSPIFLTHALPFPPVWLPLNRLVLEEPWLKFPDRSLSFTDFLPLPRFKQMRNPSFPWRLFFSTW